MRRAPGERSQPWFFTHRQNAGFSSYETIGAEHARSARASVSALLNRFASLSAAGISDEREFIWMIDMYTEKTMRLIWTSAIICLGMIPCAIAVQAQDTLLPDGSGKAQINKACSVCHSVTQVTSQRHTRAEWADLVDQMVARGAQVTDDDYKVIVDYLGKNYAPAPAKAAPSAGGTKGK